MFTCLIGIEIDKISIEKKIVLECITEHKTTRISL